jgi:hypothetical protein
VPRGFLALLVLLVLLVLLMLLVVLVLLLVLLLSWVFVLVRLWLVGAASTAKWCHSPSSHHMRRPCTHIQPN